MKKKAHQRLSSRTTFPSRNDRLSFFKWLLRLSLVSMLMTVSAQAFRFNFPERKSYLEYRSSDADNMNQSDRYFARSLVANTDIHGAEVKNLNGRYVRIFTSGDVQWLSGQSSEQPFFATMIFTANAGINDYKLGNNRFKNRITPFNYHNQTYPVRGLTAHPVNTGTETDIDHDFRILPFSEYPDGVIVRIPSSAEYYWTSILDGAESDSNFSSNVDNGDAALIDILDITTTPGVRPRFDLSVNRTTVPEGGSVVFTIRRTQGFNYPCMVYFQTVDGTATSGSGDYTAVGLTRHLFFDKNVHTQTVTVETKGDSNLLFEATETFYGRISINFDDNISEAYIANANPSETAPNHSDFKQVAVSITEVSDPPEVGFVVTNDSILEGSSPTKNISVRLNRRSSRPITVSLKDIPGLSTASANLDYRLNSPDKTTVIPANSLSGPDVTIEILDDLVYEATETVALELEVHPQSVATFDQSHFTLSIGENEPQPSVTIFRPKDPTTFDPSLFGPDDIELSTETREGEPSVSLILFLDRESELDTPIPLSLSGTATVSPDPTASDVSPIPSSIIIPAGQVFAELVIAITDDLIAEPSEALVFDLGTPTGASIGVPNTHTIIIGDNDTSDPTQSFSTTAIPQSNGFLFVQVEPSDIGGAWRFQGEQLWRPSGIPVTGLVPGNRTIEFRPVPGYNHPPSRIVEVLSDGQATPVVSARYYGTPEAGEGSLTVFLEPSTVSDLILPESDRAQWRFLEPLGAPPSPNNPWRDSSASVDDLVPGTYLIESKAIPGRTTPPPAAIEVGNSGTALTLTYFLPVASSGLAPAPTVVPFEITSTAEGLPYHYVGQVRTTLGSATGFAIKPRVVLTAAHAVFDEANLVPMSPVEWLPQRDRGSFEPLPIVPRGMIIQSGYAAERIAEASPGTFSSQSRSLDVAALYFDVDAARGSFSGWLASLDATNEWLTSGADKMLVGYPISGIPQANVGRMHATSPANLTFSSYDANFDQLYRTTDIRSFPGNSGGPLCIAHEGTYIPAGIYLGGQNEAIVRSFDLSLVLLIEEAKLKAADPGNGNVGAGFTLSSVFTYATPGSTGSIRINIEPPEAVQNNAGWWITPINTYYPSGNTVGGLTVGRTYEIEFLEAVGFDAPPPQSITVTSADTVYTATYGAPISELESWRQAHFGATENTGIAADNFDADHDGQDNHSEFIAGTNPRDSSDRFEVQSLIRSGNLVVLNYDAKAGRTYSLEKLIHNSSDNTTSWSAVSTTGVLGADEQDRVIFDLNPETNAIYRIKVVLP